MLISYAYAQDLNVNRYSEFPFESYEIGVDKNINVPDLLNIEYKNVFISKGKVKLVGKVIVPLKYNLVELHIEYCIINKTQEYTRIVQVELIKGATPNTFNFDVTYPLDLAKSEFELFVIEIYNEPKDIQLL